MTGEEQEETATCCGGQPVCVRAPGESERCPHDSTLVSQPASHSASSAGHLFRRRAHPTSGHNEPGQRTDQATCSTLRKMTSSPREETNLVICVHQQAIEHVVALLVLVVVVVCLFGGQATSLLNLVSLI